MALFGCIGVGNMGGAIALAAAKAVGGGQMVVSAKRPESARAFAEKIGAQAADNVTVARESHFVVLGVKPQFMEEVLQEIAPALRENEGVVLVTMAAGLTMKNIQQMAGGEYPVIRIMPNTPVKVGQGVILYDHNEKVSPADLGCFLQAMQPGGMVDALSENLIDAGSAVAGCGPAFASLFMEALSDGGVACGLPRQKALEYAAQMLLGTAKLMLEEKQHPGVMKDQVCSPGGSTIQGVRALEKGAFRSAVVEAVIAAYEKNKEFIR